MLQSCIFLVYTGMMCKLKANNTSTHHEPQLEKTQAFVYKLR